MKAILERMVWVGRATMLAVGFAVTLAVVLGVATTALAAVPGDPLRLGQVNGIDVITRLAGNTNTALMRINNGSTGTTATALDLVVAPGRPPMTVNSSAEVRNMNVDQVDGQSAGDFLQESSDRDDFFSGKTYRVTSSRLGNGAGSNTGVSVFCDSGDPVLGGGNNNIGGGISDDDTVLESSPTVDGGGRQGWFVDVSDNGSDSGINVDANCADFPPLR